MAAAEPDDLVARDQRCVMHPYAPPTAAGPLFAVESARGVRLALRDGRELIDGMSSWWAAIHGYNHPALNEAFTRQLGRMSHVMFGGLTHEPAVRLCERLIALTPEPLTRVFLCDSGSVSVEVALKLAVQYFHAIGRTQKRRFATVRGGYHGDTLGAMALCDPVTGMHAMFRGVLGEQLFAERPGPAFDAAWSDASLQSLAALLAQHAHELAGLVLEPIVQGAGGMRFYHPEYLRQARALCDQYGVHLVVDEIATGFGRTGTLFAHEQAGIRPDFLCLSKGLTGGTLPLSAVLTTDAVYAAFYDDDMTRGFLHSHSYTGNPLACRAALTTLDLFEQEDALARNRATAQTLDALLAPLASHPRVRHGRRQGMIWAWDIETTLPDFARRYQGHALALGLVLRPIGKTLYFMPPYVLDDEAMQHLAHGALAALEATLSEEPR